MRINNPNKEQFAYIPTKYVGPLNVKGKYASGAFTVPLSTFETTLWPSSERGIRLANICGGVNVHVISNNMTRSIILEAPSAKEACEIVPLLNVKVDILRQKTRETSSICELIELHHQVVGNLLYLRFSFNTGEASGHNMSTKASDAIIDQILQQFTNLKYVSISGNYCTDKKNSAVNGILGRGKYVVADILIPEEICTKYLRTTPVKILDLNIKKNLIGSIISGGVRTANAHFANILLAIYLSTGQDAANIIEGSQGFVHADLHGSSLYFSVTLPNIIVGTIGNGKNLPFVQENLSILGCDGTSTKDGSNAKKLASIIAATVLCSELSLLAAQTNYGELTRSHIQYERKKCKNV